MNPHHLKLFYYVAKAGGVSRAVRQIPYGIQQPSISAQVNALERDLGVALYERRPFKLTAAGETLFKFVEPFFSRITEVRGLPSDRVLLSRSSSVLCPAPTPSALPWTSLWAYTRTSFRGCR